MKTSCKPFKNRTALVIGGSRGIGRAVAIALAKEGADVAISYLRNETAAQEVASCVRKAGKKTALYRMDLRSVVEIEEMFEKIKNDYGKLDVLVYAAALTFFKPLLGLSQIQLSRVLDINAIGFVECVKRAAKLMRNGGRIVALSSLGSQRYFENYGALGLAKACVESAVRYLAVELAPYKIGVNAVSGGPVDTDGIRVAPSYEMKKKECARLTPAGRVADPEDISRIVLFLCGEESYWIRGQTVIADGGLSLRILSL